MAITSFCQDCGSKSLSRPPGSSQILTTMPPPLPHLQLRVLAAKFHTAACYLKATRPRPAATVRDKATRQWKPGSGPGFSIPTDVLMSAHKSKVLPFGPAVATAIIHSYMPMLHMAPNEKVGHAICAGNLGYYHPSQSKLTRVNRA